MDRDFRAEKLAEVHPRVLKHSQLADLTREYSLNEIAVTTRAGPAKILGLANKGHLGVDADADICIYSPDKNYQKMFELPWMVIKAGHVLIETLKYDKPSAAEPSWLNQTTIAATTKKSRRGSNKSIHCH